MAYPWTMPLFLSISLYTFLCLTQLSLSLSNNQITDDVHDLLPQYGFPPGLIPNAVKSFTISADDGSFVIELETTCYVQFNDLVYYDKTIKGKLSYGSVTDVSGIQAKKLFVWVPVTEIHVDSKSGTIVFYVGPFSEKFPAKQFENIPNCRRKGSQHSSHPQSI